MTFDKNKTQVELNHQLLAAARNGQSEQVTALIAQGAHLNAANLDGDTALMWAAIIGRAAIATALMSSVHFDAIALNTTNQFGETALILAVIRGDATIVTALLSSDYFDSSTLNAATHNGNTALMLAATYGRADIMTTLLSSSHFNATTLNAIDYNGNTALMLATRNGHNDVAFRLLNSMSTQAIIDARPNPFFIDRVFFRTPVISPIEASYNQALTQLRQGLRNIVNAFNEEASRPNLGRANSLMNIISGYYAPNWCLNPNREMQDVLREITNPVIFSRTSNIKTCLQRVFNRRKRKGSSLDI